MNFFTRKKPVIQLDLKKNNVEIISVPDNQIAKNDVFNKLNHLINNHRTFPIVIYETSKGKQYFIGGNDVFMSLIRLSESYQLHRDKIIFLNIY